MEIIDVVKDFQFLDITRNVELLVLRYHSVKFGVAAIKAECENISANLSFLKQTRKKVNPNTKFEYQFYDEQLLFIHFMLSDVAKILVSLSLLAVVVFCLGLLGMAAYTAQTSAKEISIRKILGSGVVLFNGMRLQNLISQTNFSYKAAEMDCKQAQDNLVLNVILAYMQVILGENVLTVSKAQMLVIKKQIERMEVLVKEGLAGHFQLTDIKGQMANEEINIINL